MHDVFLCPVGVMNAWFASHRPLPIAGDVSYRSR